MIRAVERTCGCNCSRSQSREESCWAVADDKNIGTAHRSRCRATQSTRPRQPLPRPRNLRCRARQVPPPNTRGSENAHDRGHARCAPGARPPSADAGRRSRGVRMTPQRRRCRAISVPPRPGVSRCGLIVWQSPEKRGCQFRCGVRFCTTLLHSADPRLKR